MNKHHKRNLALIDISGKLTREKRVTTSTKQIVDQIFREITELVLREDAAVIRTMDETELTSYMHVEVFMALDQMYDEIELAGTNDHTGDTKTCEICIKMDRIEFISDCLISIWKQMGIAEYMHRLISFRDEALAIERVVN